jgi:hypothetical protein
MLQEPDSVHVQLLFQKLIDSNIARHQVLVNETTCPVYFGELFDSVQEGISTTQEELQPSQFVLFQSSHCSHAFGLPLPHASYTVMLQVTIQSNHPEKGFDQVSVTIYVQVLLSTLEVLKLDHQVHIEANKYIEAPPVDTFMLRDIQA